MRSGADIQNSVTQNIPPQIDTAITFDTVATDTDGYFQTSAPTRLTVPAGKGGGFFSVKGQWGWSNNGLTLFHSKIRLNGNAIIAEQIDQCGNSSRHNQISRDIVLQDGDYVELIAFNNDPGKVRVLAADCWFTITS